MADYDALMQELLQMFAVEAAEHIQTLNATMLKLEKQPGGEEKQQLLNAAFRAAHSIKGSARAVGLMDIEGIAHDAEAVLSAGRSGKLDFTPDVVDVVLQATDEIQNLLNGEKPAEGQLENMRQRLKGVAENSGVAKPAEVAPPPAPVAAVPTLPPAPTAPPPAPAQPKSGGLDALMQELLDMFSVEAAEHIQTLNQTLLALEKQPPDNEKKNLLNAAFRAAHSIKGSARAVELMEIEGVAHDAEAVLSAARSGKLEFTSDVVDVLLQATDAIQNLVDGQTIAPDQMQNLRNRLKGVAENPGAAQPAPSAPVAAVPVPPSASVAPPPPPQPEPAKPKSGGLDALMQELLDMFSVEAAEHIQTLNQTLLALEKQPPDNEKKNLLNAAFRAAHSIKGSARAVELMEIEGVAHDAEAVLSAARSGKLEFTSDVVDALLQGTDAIQNLVDGQTIAPDQMQNLRNRLKGVAEGGAAPKAAESPAKPAAPPPSAPAKPASVSVTPKPADSGLDALMKELLQMFAVEAAEHIQTLSQTMLRLEKQPTGHERQELLNAAFRAAHSLKGSARAVELLDIEGVSHDAEAVLSAARSGKLEFTPEVVDVLLQATDAIQNMVEGKVVSPEQLGGLRQRLKMIAPEAAQPPAAPAKPAAPPAPPPQAVIPAAPTAPAPVTPAPVAATPLPPPPQKVVTESAPPPASEVKKPPVKPSSLSTGAPEETIRVSVEKLDDLMAQAGELIVSKISADERLRELRDLRSLMGRWEKVWTETTDLRRRIDRYSREAEEEQEWKEVLDFLTVSQRYFAESVDKMRALDKAMTSDNMRMTLVTDAIQDEIRRVRMLPVETLVPTMERIVRDVARQGDKKATFIVRGADVELDKKVLEALKDPLVHLLRNSVDHGVETPDVRRESGKPEVGRVTLSVSQRGGNVHIIVSDDGKGLDAAAIKRSAVRKGQIQQNEADNMTDEEAFLLIFMPGLSTKEEVTSVSGRGVGMDVVKAQVENLQGRINVRSVVGHGSEFHLIVPISLATIRGLMVRIGLDRYALPLHAVEKIVTIFPNRVYKVEGVTMFDLDQEPMPVLYLADVLERPRDEPRTDRLLAIIVAGADRRMAFVVDDFISEQEMVVKTLGKQLRRVRNVAGATLLGTGHPIVILNVADLIKSAQGGRSIRQPIYVQRRAEDEKEKPPPKILVVDDSITTRTLEKNILTGAGYDVFTATDGVEALALLETERFDLVVSDIEMPRINGFDLVEYIRNSPKYGDTPIVLVTSLESQEHRERGLKAGADAYIVKSGFEQSTLLATIKQFVL